MEYPKFKVGDRVVVLETAKEATVAAFRPKSSGVGYKYDFRLDDGSERTRPEWVLASPDECVFCVVGHEALDGDGSMLWTDGAYRKRDDAVKRLGEIADNWIENIGKCIDRYQTERSDDSFEAWEDGYYDNNHFSVVVNACRLA